jgi:hypothetical protein
VRRAVIAALCGLALACLKPRGYRCEEDSNCDLDGKTGRCQDTGYCSYPDPDCPSGQRYEPDAGAGLGDACVPGSGAAGTDSGSDGGGSSGAETSGTGT